MLELEEMISIACETGQGCKARETCPADPTPFYLLIFYVFFISDVRFQSVFILYIKNQGRGVFRCFLSWLAAWGLVCVLLFLHRWSALVR